MSEERSDALDIVEAGLSAIDTVEAIREHVSVAGNQLKIKDKILDLDNYKNVYIVGLVRWFA